MKAIFENYLTVSVILITLFIAFVVTSLGIVLLVEETTESEVVGLKNFNSCTSMVNYIDDLKGEENNYPYLRDFEGISAPISDSFDSTSSLGSAESSVEYSNTNIQEENVDEGDIIKTNGVYLYLLKGNSDNDEFSLEIREITDDGADYGESYSKFLDFTPREFYLNNNKVVILGTEDLTGGFGNNGSRIEVWDVSNPVDIKVNYSASFDANLLTSRVNKNVFYFVGNYYESRFANATADSIEELLPLVEIQKDGYEIRDYECSDVSAFGESYTNMIMLHAIDLSSLSDNTELILGETSGHYMSEENLFLTTRVFDISSRASDPLFDPVETSIPIEPSSINTEILKLGLDKTEFDSSASGKVNGTLLNQFSMDEFGGNLRIATTTNGYSQTSENMVYILDDDLEELGSIDNIARGEGIYSARFIEDRLYLVTFRQVDPFYVIDLSNSNNPQILGELKLPGFSNYLHPYSENIIIGFGRETNRFGSVQGLKVALFDVSDPSNPQTLDTYELGDETYTSDAETNHKAFNYLDDEKLLILPYEFRNSVFIEDSNSADLESGSGFSFIDLSNSEISTKTNINFGSLENSGFGANLYNLGSRSLKIGEYIHMFKNNELQIAEIN